MENEQLYTVLRALPDDLAALDGVLAHQRGAAWLAQRDALIRRVRGLIGRLERSDEPLLVVLAGGTGAGKSTLANTLAGQPAATTSARRPTTSVPTAIGRLADLDTVLRCGVLSAQSASGGLHAVAVEQMPAGLVVVDAPDIDSVEAANHAVTERLLELADVWLWLTTARTYADEAGMCYLRRAARLDASIVVVLTQVAPHEAEEIVPDLADKLLDAGHPEIEIYTLPTAQVTDQQLPATAAAPVCERIRALAPSAERAAHRRRTVLGGARALPVELSELLAAVAAERAEVDALGEQLEQVYADSAERVMAQLHEGAPLRHEVLRRWTELVGTGWLQRQLQATVGRLPRLLAHLPFVGRRGEEVREQATQEARNGVAEIVRTVFDQAAAEVEVAWRERPAGRALLAHTPSPRGAGRVAQAEVAQQLVAAWEGRIAEHVATIGQEKLVRARRATTGINATVTSAAVVLFTLSGGLTAGEVALTAAGSTTTHTVLSRILGERNVNQLIAEIRDDLRRRVALQADVEATCYRQLLLEAAPTAAASATVGHYRELLEGVGG